MKFTMTRDPLPAVTADIVAVCCTAPGKDRKEKIGSLSRTDGGMELDKVLGGLLSETIRHEEFCGEPGQYRVLPTMGKIPARAVIVLGIGTSQDYSLETARRIGATFVRVAQQIKARSVAGAIQIEAVKGFSPADRTKALVQGIVLGSYRFDQYKSKRDRAPHVVQTVLLTAAKDRTAIEAAITEGQTIAEATNFARDLVNIPGNICTPQYLADQAKQMAKQAKLDCTVFDHKAILAHRMTLLNAVAQGAVNPPTFIHLRYTPTKKPKARIALVGKGVTFDTGGVDLKSSKHMEHMKNDMAGAAAVLAATRVAAQLRLPVAIDAFLPCTENVIDGKSHRPGDIVTSRNGKTVELLNLDAEGRLVLADAIDYALEKKPDLVIDVATLTGGVLYAVGEIYSAVVGNDQPLINRLLAASKAAGEPMWQLPLEQEYKKGFKSGPADLRNIGKTSASTISGALFLEEFVGDRRWAHLDIAASSWSDDDRPYTPKGGTGASVRTLCELLLSF